MLKMRIMIIGALLASSMVLFPASASARSPDGVSSVPIKADAAIAPSYSVKADPYLELSWNKKRKDYEGTYHVGVKGRIAGNKAIRIKPAESFKMTSGKKSRTGSVKQEHTRWAMSSDRSDTLLLSDTEYVMTTGNAAIKIPGTAVYRGGIQFTFSME